MPSKVDLSNYLYIIKTTEINSAVLFKIIYYTFIFFLIIWVLNIYASLFIIIKIYKTNRNKLLDEAIELLLERQNFKKN